MTTKVITAFIIVLVLFGGWNLFLYWDKVKNEESEARKQAAAQAAAYLPGMPQGLEESFAKAKAAGAQTLQEWLRLYGPSINDPRKAAIELDYAMLLSRENPAEARRVFAAVKARTRETSPVYKRIKELEKTYE